MCFRYCHSSSAVKTIFLVLLQVCTVVNDSTMTCLAPPIVYTKRQAPESGLHPDEFGLILDHVSSLLILNGTPFTYYPNPTFDPLGNAGILEVKPGSPIILKVALFYLIFFLISGFPSYSQV